MTKLGDSFRVCGVAMHPCRCGVPVSDCPLSYAYLRAKAWGGLVHPQLCSDSAESQTHIFHTFCEF